MVAGTADFPRRSQIWEYVLGSRQFRVLIISTDEYNEQPGAYPWALVIEREAPSVPGYVVELPGGSAVIIPRVVRVDPSALRYLVGLIGDERMTAVERGLRDFIGLA